MTTNLKKETTEKTIDMEGNEKTEVVNLELSVMDGENERGSVHISKHGVNFSLYGGEYDIEEWKTKIENLIKKEIAE